MKRDNSLIIALVAQASVNAAASSAYLAQIAPTWLVALVGLLNSMMLAGTAAYVAATKGSQARQFQDAAVAAAVEAVQPTPAPAPTQRQTNRTDPYRSR